MIRFIALFMMLLAGERARASAQLYPAPAGVAESPLYKVEIGPSGSLRRSFVYVSAAQQKTNTSKDTAWTSFSLTGHVRVKVTKLAGAFHSCRVLPSSRDVRVTLNGQAACFTLSQPGQYSIEFDGSIVHPLLIFADPPQHDIPNRHDPHVIWFGPGIHRLASGKLTVQSHQTVYLAPGAYVMGRIIARDARHVRIIGRGILCGRELPRRASRADQVRPLIDLEGSSDDARVEGITLIDAPEYNVMIRGVDARVRNVKMIGWWYSTDGVGTGAGGDVEDCFFKVNDDAIKLYHSGMVVRRCVIWQLENGAPFQISWNTNTDASGVLVDDCDVIRVEHHGDANNRGIFCAVHGGSGNLSDYRFQNIRIENAHWRLFLLTIKKTRWSHAARFGSITHLLFRNITAEGPFERRSVIRCEAPTGSISDITFQNLRIGGRVIHNVAEGGFDIAPDIASTVRFVDN